MTRAEFEAKSFEECMQQLKEEFDSIHTYDEMKQFLQWEVDDERWYMVRHIATALEADFDEEWWDYDLSMGTLDKPVSLTEKADIEHLIEDDESEVD